MMLPRKCRLWAEVQLRVCKLERPACVQPFTLGRTEALFDYLQEVDDSRDDDFLLVSVGSTFCRTRLISV